MILGIRVTEVKVRHKVIKGVEGVMLGCFFSSFSEHIISVVLALASLEAQIMSSRSTGRLEAIWEQIC